MTSITLGSIVKIAADFSAVAIAKGAHGEVVRVYPNGDVEVKWLRFGPLKSTRLELRDLEVVEDEARAALAEVVCGERGA